MPHNPPMSDRINGFCDVVCASESTSFDSDKGFCDGVLGHLWVCPFVHCFFQDEAVLSVIMAKAARIPAFDVVCWV